MCKLGLLAIAVMLCRPAVLNGQDDCRVLPPNGNRKVVISDLHLGAGHLSTGQWHPLEDFRFGGVFTEFLKREGSGGRTDLVVAGDFIDFWQLLPEIDAARPANQGSSEAESIRKLQVALSGHRE